MLVENYDNANYPALNPDSLMHDGLWNTTAFPFLPSNCNLGYTYGHIGFL